MLTVATIEKIETRADRTVKVTIGTRELSPQEMAELFAYSNNEVKLYITSEGVRQDVIDAIDSEVLDIAPTVKSPSQRLRGVLFRLWEQDNEGYDDFNLYYLNKMEKFIDWIKNKLT